MTFRRALITGASSAIGTDAALVLAENGCALWITALDIGQGSSILVESGDVRLLYDPGPGQGGERSTAARFLLNEVISCAGPSGPVDRCSERLAVAARGGVTFDY